jgi:hypothetical protein
VTRALPQLRLAAALFAGTVFFSVTLVSFIVSMCFSAFVYENEGEAIAGLGLLWFFSIPVWGGASLLSVLAFRWYEAASSFAGRAGRYTIVLLAVFATAPLAWAVRDWIA